MQNGASARYLRSYSAMLILKVDGRVEVMVRQIMGRERAISYSLRIRLNGGCIFVAGRKLCCLSGNMVIL